MSEIPSDVYRQIADAYKKIGVRHVSKDLVATWWQSEESGDYSLGCSDFETREAMIFTVEAARSLCCGSLGNDQALRLLKMAVKSLETIQAKPKPSNIISVDFSEAM